MNGKASVEFAGARMFGVGQNYAAAFGIKLAEDARQFHLIGLAELVWRVAFEIRESGDGQIRRVKVDEIAPASLVHRLAEVLRLELCGLQDIGRSQNVVAGIEVGILVRANGCVELALGVDAI